MKITTEGIFANCPVCNTEFMFISKECAFNNCPNCLGKKNCENCLYNYGNLNNTEFNPEDIVCEYWNSDGLTTEDFCSKWKWKGEQE